MQSDDDLQPLLDTLRGATVRLNEMSATIQGLNLRFESLNEQVERCEQILAGELYSLRERLEILESWIGPRPR